MTPPRPAPLRIFEDGSADPDPAAAAADPATLAARELLRPPGKPGRRDLEPFTRGWFEELEIKRYARHGGWLRRCLEFTRHPGESLLMLGPGVGSDALQYQRHGTQVTVCATDHDAPDAVRANFAVRGLPLKLVHAGPDFSLPFDRWAFDLAYWNAVHPCPADPIRVANELYRVLKPGGKLLALFPARYDVGFWQHILLPFRRWYRPPGGFTDAPRYSGSAARHLFAQFAEHRVSKRHLRRGELPYLWRFLPPAVLERLMGRVLVLRAFKPVTAALEVIPHDTAA